MEQLYAASFLHNYPLLLNKMAVKQFFVNSQSGKEEKYVKLHIS